MRNLFLKHISFRLHRRLRMLHSVWMTKIITGKFIHKWKRRSVDVPSRDVPYLSIFWPQRRQMRSWRHAMTSCDVMTSCCDTTWCQLSCQNGSAQSTQVTSSKNPIFKCGDLDLWPMTLTFKLGWDFIMVILHTKFRGPKSNGSARRELTNRHTDGHTDGRDRFYTLDRWRGRELKVTYFMRKVTHSKGHVKLNVRPSRILDWVLVVQIQSVLFVFK